MNIGNFLTVFSILIALVGFAYNSNRKIIIYKLSKSDYIIAIVLVLLANYLLLFDWVEANGWYFDCFMHEGNSYLLPNQWAYIVTSLLLFYVMYKFWVCNRIPERNRTKLLRYYGSCAKVRGKHVGVLTEMRTQTIHKERQVRYTSDL